VLSVGVSSGAVGITVAHELIHRPNRFERGLGVIILASVLYGHFRIEHVVGHHAKVATPRDPATARRGQSVYRFWVQSVAGGLADAWTIESRRRKRLGRSVVSPANRLIRYAGVSGVLGGLLGLAFGPEAIAYFILQGVVAFSLLEVVNYIEHYGLTRRWTGDRYERVSPVHSWNSSRRLTNWFLVNLQRHSDHHFDPSRRYQLLRHIDESPQLPTGYGALVPLALIPGLWRRRIEPILDRRSSVDGQPAEHHAGDNPSEASNPPE
jgi:alkane 1-monooxygenase